MGKVYSRSSGVAGLDEEVPPNPRDPREPRAYLRGLRPDIDLEGYKPYSDDEFGKLVRVTRKGYDALRRISHIERDPERPHDGYSCIITVFGKPKLIDSIAAPMNEGEATYKQELGVPFLERPQEEVVDILRRLGNHGPTGLDGAFCFDLEGNLYATEMRIAMPLNLGLNGTREEIRRAKGSIGTKHEAAAYASKHGIAAVALSAEVGTVITFIGGKVIPEFTYRPAKKT